MSTEKPSPRLDALIGRMSSYCAEQRGRKAALAKFLGVRPHMVSEWLSGTSKPSAENALGILDWLADGDS